MKDSAREAFEAHFKGQIRFQDFDIRYGRYVAKEPYVFGTDRQADEANTLFEGYKAALSGAQQGPVFHTESDFVEFLDGLYAMDDNGGLTGGKYESAQIAIRAIRGAQQGEAEPVATLHVREDGRSATYALDELSVLPVGKHDLFAAPQPAQVPEEWRDTISCAETMLRGCLDTVGTSDPQQYEAVSQICDELESMLTAAPSGDAKREAEIKAQGAERVLHAISDAFLEDDSPCGSRLNDGLRRAIAIAHGEIEEIRQSDSGDDKE